MDAFYLIVDCDFEGPTGVIFFLCYYYERVKRNIDSIDAIK